MVTRYVIRLYLFGLILAAGFAVLLWRLWVVQIEDHKKYLAQLPQAALVFHRTAGIRGEIKDRNGKALATNKVSYEIKLDLREIERDYRYHHKEVPRHHYPFKDNFGTRRQREEADIFAMYEAEVAPRLKQLNLFAELDPEEMRLHYRTNRGVIPFTYRKQVGFEEIALVAEQSQFLTGVTISKRTLRHYPYGAMLGHVLGYVKQVGELDIPEEDAGKYDFYEGDDKGIAGIEKRMDDKLRARAGQRVFPKDEHGKIVHNELMDRRVEPIKGDDVFLTIDVEVQAIAEMALREAGVGRGAAVVMDPRSGDVLALVSVPSYDPNKFIPEIELNDWKAYEDDKSLPLVNRALSAYAPGSVYKVPIALAGCARGQSKRILMCGGGMLFGGHFSKCTGSHGNLGLSDALMRSCNGYFYRYGIATKIEGIDRIQEWFSLGEPTGIELPREDAGVLPGPDRVGGGEMWSEAQTAFTAIGQGQVLTTPLQMCAVAATVANGGMSYRPRLIHSIYDQAEKVSTAEKPKLKVDLVASKAISGNDFELVRKGLWKVVNGEGGTARGIRSKDYEIAGKTGTAQAWLDGKSHKDDKNKDYKTWFIAFAPYEAPRYAVCVFVENGTSGGGTSAPIAARILKQAMARDKGTYAPPLQALAEAKGHFDRLERTVYADDPVDAAILAAAAATAEDPVVEAEPPATTRRPSAARRRKPQTEDRPKIKTRSSAGARSDRSPRPASAPAPAPAPRTLMDKFLKRDQAQ
jgi:penicillin-binding protein 2